MALAGDASTKSSGFASVDPCSQSTSSLLIRKRGVDGLITDCSLSKKKQKKKRKRQRK